MAAILGGGMFPYYINMNADEKAQLLVEYLDANAQKPFQWGQHDCCLFASGWAERVTGTDVATELGLRGTYSTLHGALNVLSNYSGSVVGVMDAAKAIIPLTEVKRNYSKRGDVLTYTDPETNFTALGINAGHAAAFVSVDGGLAYYPITECGKTAWRIN